MGHWGAIGYIYTQKSTHGAPPGAGLGTGLTRQAYIDSEGCSEGQLSKDSVTFSDCFCKCILCPSKQKSRNLQRSVVINYII